MHLCPQKQGWQHPKLQKKREQGHDVGGWKEVARTLLSTSFPGASCCPGLCYNQAPVPGEGLEFQGGIPGGCPLTMPLWLAVPEVPTVEGAVPMVLLLGSLL